MRLAIAALLAAAIALDGGGVVLNPQTPVITEPASDGQIISAYDVHMVAGPFAGAPGESHVCSDWEIRAAASTEIVWTAPCVRATLAVHIHLGDGTFVNSLTGHHQLDADTDYTLRVRFKGDAGAPDAQWSAWAERPFRTAPATAIEPLVLSDVAPIPAPRWQDEASRDVVLPAGPSSPELRLEAFGAGALLTITGKNGGNRWVNSPALSGHGSVRVVCDAGSEGLSLPASHLSFTDGSGADRVLYLPAISLAGGQTIAFWISAAGEAFAADVAPAEGASANFASQVSASPVPWAVKQPGFRIERVATGFQLPVNIAFLPNPGPGSDDPLFYVTELYGTIQVVSRSGRITPYASGLLNFDPTGPFPGSGEKGLTGIAVDPASGDVFVGAVEANPGVTDVHFPRVIRLHSVDGGRTAASRTTILDFPNEPVGPSHQTSNVTVGPDGKLYVHIGDGAIALPGQDLTSVRGKILRVNLDGSVPPDNPLYDASDGLTAKDLVFAYGFRNPFGGAWRAADGAHWEVENGPNVDRLAKVVAGRNYLWDGTNASMYNYAAYVWPIAVAPVNIAFVQPATFGGSGFPSDRMDHAFVTESGPTYAPGPQGLGKRVSEFVFDADGNRTSGPLPLIEYVGAGRATASALAAGPDGLYFADLYKDFGASDGTAAGANVFRIVFTGVAEFSADTPSGPAPLTVSFVNSSTVPHPTAWRWDFGDGSQSDESNPAHVYMLPAAYDVRLTVTGSTGPSTSQKPGFVVVAPAVREVACCLPLPRPTPVTVPPR